MKNRDKNMKVFEFTYTLENMCKTLLNSFNCTRELSGYKKQLEVI